MGTGLFDIMEQLPSEFVWEIKRIFLPCSISVSNMLTSNRNSCWWIHCSRRHPHTRIDLASQNTSFPQAIPHGPSLLILPGVLYSGFVLLLDNPTNVLPFTQVETQYSSSISFALLRYLLFYSPLYVRDQDILQIPPTWQNCQVFFWNFFLHCGFSRCFSWIWS